MKVTGGMTVNNNGIGVNGFATFYNDVQVNGDQTITGSLVVGATTYPSDRRLKRDITPLRNNLESITKLRGVYFKWSQSHDDSATKAKSDRRHVGLIAQDVQAVFPEVVTNIYDDEYLGVNYAELVPVLVEAIRELNDNHIELSGEFDILHDKFLKLEKTIASLLHA